MPPLNKDLDEFFEAYLAHRIIHMSISGANVFALVMVSADPNDGLEVWKVSS